MKPYRDVIADELDAAQKGEDWKAIEELADELDRLTPTRRVPVLSAALWYASHGLPVFPVRPGDKKPFPRTRGVLDATTNPEQITAWWTAEPEANVGVATGFVVDVVDFDGPAAHAAWGRVYGDTWGGLTVLGTVSTPRAGGLHLYVPALPHSKNRAHMLDGVDYRGRGGYVVAPPSKTPLGPYRFLRPLDPEDLRRVDRAEPRTTEEQGRTAEAQG